MNDTQIIATVLSIDEHHRPDILSLLAASATLSASDIPFFGPFASVRVGLQNGQFVANPSMEVEDKLDLNMVFSGLKGRVLAVEADAKEVPDNKIYEAYEFALKEIEPLIDFIEDFASALGVTNMSYDSYDLDATFVDAVKKEVLLDVKKAVMSAWADRVDQTLAIEEKIFKKFEGKYTKSAMKRALYQVEKEATRELILKDNKRPDGRKFDEIRPLSASVGVLPRTHGSGLFTRGLTQALTVVTLGSASQEQLIQNMYGEETKRYIHHYNGPPFSLGETGSMKGPGRREIGHGVLAEKALRAVIPADETFPYTIRLVSEILSQQGSSSMAATCGSTLALMDAGVPIKAPVAGVAVGLFVDKDEKNFVVVTDIANFEDFYGFMDYKMTGTRQGVTAIQLDVKLKGIPIAIFKQIIESSKNGRIKIIDFIEKIIQKPRDDISVFAPRVAQVTVKKDQIGLVIGSGGKTIKSVMEKTGTTIDVEEKGEFGIVIIASKDKDALKKAKEIIEALVKEVLVGDIYEGTIVKIVDFGAFVEVLPGKEGLLHVSEISHSFVSNVHELFKEGDKIKVKVIGAEDGKISLSSKDFYIAPEGVAQNSPRNERRDLGHAQRQGVGFGGRGRAGNYDRVQKGGGGSNRPWNSASKRPKIGSYKGFGSK